MSNVIKIVNSWYITSKGIHSIKRPDFFLPKERLWETRNNNWEWLIHMSEKTWVIEDSMTDFTEIFKFAQEYFSTKKVINT